MMFKRSITLIAAGVMLAGMIAGTGAVGSMAAETTTKDEAKEIALKDAGLTEDEVSFGEIEKGTEQGASVYEIEFWTDSKEYEYDIALADGQIVCAEWELVDPSVSGKKITEAQAKTIACENAGVSESKVTYNKSKSGTENGIPVYELKFEDSEREFEYEISKEGGEILNCSMKVKTPDCVKAAAEKAAEAK